MRKSSVGTSDRRVPLEDSQLVLALAWSKGWDQSACEGPERTADVQQHSPGLLDDDRPGGDVPAVDPDLEEGLHRPRGHQTHVGGGRPGPTQPVGKRESKQVKR